MSANGVKADGTPYQRTKYQAEEYLRASPLHWTIFQPSVIFGDPRGRMEFATGTVIEAGIHGGVQAFEVLLEIGGEADRGNSVHGGQVLDHESPAVLGQKAHIRDAVVQERLRFQAHAKEQ